MIVERIPITGSPGTKSAGFDADLGVILIEHADGAIWLYHGCTQEQFDALLIADKTPKQSVGGFITTSLRTNKWTKF